MSEFWHVTFPTPGSTASTAKSLEDAGWDGVFFPDTQCLSGDVYSALALAASATSRIMLGPGVTNPVTRHPSVTASAIATIQVESNGRAVLGFGRGDSSLAYIGQKPAPVSVFDSYLTDVQQYLKGDAVDIDGYESRNTWLADTGLPKVEVDVAATGPRVISAAAVSAERITFAVGADPKRLAASIEIARAARAAADLDPNDLSFGAYVNCTANPDAAKARQVILGTVGVFAHFSGMAGADTSQLDDGSVFESVAGNYDMANHARSGAAHVSGLDDDFVDRFAVAGTPAYCVDRLGELLDAGLDRLVFVTASRDADPTEVQTGNTLLATEVLPQLR
ncbi:MAG: LLM class flavin-dependent oxidoreductase [Acidimicrobiales bacterium]